MKRGNWVVLLVVLKNYEYRTTILHAAQLLQYFTDKLAKDRAGDVLATPACWWYTPKVGGSRICMVELTSLIYIAIIKKSIIFIILLY
jgi:hypothetical protein